MPDTNALLVVVITFGVIVAVQGILGMRGKRVLHPNFFERPLIEALQLKKQAQVNRVLGRVRLVYGVFIAVAGIWAMMQ